MKVLISVGYGAGWSTWNQKELAIDPEVIELFERGCTEEEMYNFCVSCGYVDSHGNGPFMGGFDELVIVEVPKGRVFRVGEYDGNEFIESFYEDEWITAT